MDDELTLGDRATEALNRANARYTAKTNPAQSPPAIGFMTGRIGKLYSIDTTQGTYTARNLSTGEPGLNDIVSLNVPRQGSPTFTVISH